MSSIVANPLSHPYNLISGPTIYLLNVPYPAAIIVVNLGAPEHPNCSFPKL